jgi:hypothetical protein
LSAFAHGGGDSPGKVEVCQGSGEFLSGTFRFPHATRRGTFEDPLRLQNGCESARRAQEVTKIVVSRDEKRRLGGGTPMHHDQPYERSINNSE